MPNVTLNIPGELLNKARAHAASEFRSLSQQFAFLVTADTARRRVKPAAAPAVKAASRQPAAAPAPEREPAVP